MLLYKNSFINISKIYIFIFVFNIYIKSLTINTINTIKNISIYTNFFVINKDNNNKKETTLIIKNIKKLLIKLSLLLFLFA